MQIMGIGTDIVEIVRITRIWNKYGMQFAKHILSAVEMEEFSAKADKAKFLAKRFALKEAIVKALGTGFRGEVFFTNISIVHDQLGKPMVEFLAKTQKHVESLGKIDLQISVADEHKYVVAFVMLSVFS